MAAAASAEADDALRQLPRDVAGEPVAPVGTISFTSFERALDVWWDDPWSARSVQDKIVATPERVVAARRAAGEVGIGLGRRREELAAERARLVGEQEKVLLIDPGAH